MVSVIVPAYNCEKYIDKCLDSLVRQTYADIEIIVIDDGSKDSTWTKLQEWAAKDKRIVARHYDNSGVVKTRKRGLELAHGDRLMFVDSDDYLPDNAIAILMKSANDADIVVGSYSLEWVESGRIVPIHHPKDFTTPVQCAAYCLKYGETFLPIKLYKTDIFRASVDIPDDICVQEDTIGILQYLRHCSSVSHTDDSVYYYLKHEDSASYSLSPRHLNSLIKVAAWLSNEYSVCTDITLLTEVEKTCIKNQYAYITHTQPAERDTQSISKILCFIKGHPTKLPSSYHYQLLAVEESLSRPAVATVMISAYESYIKTKKTIKECVRKILK